MKNNQNKMPFIYSNYNRFYQFRELKKLAHFENYGIIDILHGDVAQLGEHQVRNLGVEGSIPFVSTIATHKFF